MLLRLPMVLAIAASMTGAAYAHSSVDDQILAELPANAPPGECYARVVKPSEPAGPPPMMMGAQWVLNQGPPGSPGPIWCLVPTGPVPAGPAPVTPTEYGWIRVLCDTEATPARIKTVQQRLHDRGYYRGQVSGRYDQATAAAVTQFQESAHIEHGGYLSLQTIDVLDSQSAYSAPAAPVYAGGYSYQQASAYPVQAPSPCAQACYAPPPPPPPPPVYYQPQPCYCAPVYYQQPVYQQPVYQPPAYAPPCCAAQTYQAYQGGYVQGGFQSGYQTGYYAGSPAPAYATAGARASASAYAGGASASAYASSTSAIQNGWLTWGGMSRY